MRCRNLLAEALFSANFSSPLEIQELEQCQLLTGQETVSISKSGDIHFVGDNVSNDISIQINANTISLVGHSGISITSGNQVVAPGVPLNVAKPPVVRHVIGNLKGGNDQLDVTANAAATVNRDIKVDTGSANDSLTLESNGVVISVAGVVSVNTGSGNDVVPVVDSVKFAWAIQQPSLRQLRTTQRQRRSLRCWRGSDSECGLWKVITKLDASLMNCLIEP